MSSLAFLVTELQSLATETKRKHPDIREAAEKSLAILRAAPEQATSRLALGPQSDDLLRPVFMGCSTKNAKVVAISLGSLQRLITLKAVPQSAVPVIISTMSEAMSQGVDIQLRVLQTLVSLFPNFPDIHGSLLADALLLCFRLQESKIAVVSSTAAASLRQLVMFVVDKVVTEDRLADNKDIPGERTTQVTLPDGSTRSLGPSATDAFSVFEDLCLLANAEKPKFLKLEFLHKTLTLELIESVLTNYHELFRKHVELVLLLRHHLCPLLLRTLSERPQFSLSLRCIRVVFLLLKQFSFELKTEAEVFLSLLIRIIGDDHSSLETGEHSQQHSTSRPHWMRVMAMEIMRGLCTDAELIRNMWDRYDSQEAGSKAVISLITALKRLVTEKPALLGQSSQMGGIGVAVDTSGSGAAAYGLDMAGRVASATVSGVAGMIGVGGVGLSVQNSSMKLQCIDQLDKADAPPIPESYVYLLAVQSIVSLCEGFASFSGPIYSNLVIQRPRAAGDPAIKAPPALDLNTLPAEEPQTLHLRIVQSIISQAWPALLAALSFIIATNLSDDLFVEVLASYQALTNVSGMLNLATPRDAFFNSLSKFAVPTPVVSSMEQWAENPPLQTPRSATVALTEGLGLSGPFQPPGLSERNMACLKVFLGCALFLAGSLGESWYAVLESLQNADGVLTLMLKTGGIGGGKKGLFAGVGVGTPSSGSAPSSRAPSLSVSQSQSNSLATTSTQNQKHPLLSDLDVETMQLAIQRLFDSSKNLEDNAFREFVNALCKLSGEMVGMQASEQVVPVNVFDSEDGGNGLLSVSSNRSQDSMVHRRRISGIFIPKNLQKSGDFGIAKLGGVVMLNIHRLIFRSPDIAWDKTTSHLIMVMKLPYAPQTIRIQAARVLDEILLIIPRHLINADDLQADVQQRILGVLSQQVILDSKIPASQQTSTSVELRRMGLETLHQILEATGHTIVLGWETIFQMLGSVCRPLNVNGGSASTPRIPPSRSQSTDSLSPGSPNPSGINRPKPLAIQIGLGNPSEKSFTILVKIAFQSLTLVCDSVSSLSPEHLRLCISTLGQFGRQADTNIALTAAASLLWSVSDAIQSKRKNVDEEPEYSELWMFLLLEVLGLCTDPRAEVRDGAIQTLFRTMQLYGASLSQETWDQCIWKVTFPLLNSLTAEIRKLTDPDLELDQATIHAWDESKILALTSTGFILSDFLVSKIMLLESFPKAWDALVQNAEETILLDNRIIGPPALRCLEQGVTASKSAEGVLRVRVLESLERVWQAFDNIGASATKRFASSEDLENSPHKPFTQEGLVAYVELIQSVRTVHKSVDGKEWDLSRLTRLVAILRGVLTYPHSPDYRPDVDGLPPVQAIVLSTIQDIDLSIPGSPSLILRDLSYYSTLAFLASFDVVPHSKSQMPQGLQKRITYIAVSKKAMPMIVDLFMKFKADLKIYVDGTVESILSAFSVPIKLKYDCPAPSKFGKDPPLWKTATTCFLSVVKESTAHLEEMDVKIPDERVEGIWRQTLDVFKGGMLADCSATESLPLDLQETEENFDLALIASLEADVMPRLGSSRISDDLVSQLGAILSKSSQVYEPVDGTSSLGSASLSSSSSPNSTASTSPASSKQKDLSSPSHPKYGPRPAITPLDVNFRYSEYGSSSRGKYESRERFTYWSFDLLFLICSKVEPGLIDLSDRRKRLAALNLSSLLNRCKNTLVGYVADESLRGNSPFTRAREEEVIYVLRKLLNLVLWPGSLWAAMSDDPTQYCDRQPSLGADIPVPSTPRKIIADSYKRSPKAHLFHLYPVICEIASIPRKGALAWVPKDVAHTALYAKTSSINEQGIDLDQESSFIKHDARSLAKDCLMVIGQELGISG
ncbi:hypothetical protein CPB83DRAFT_850328 [Crepidotus variabilis]|uniref:Protein MON2 homolog n=1 Tax=Crepidotus variabilis TaxID=179855 RepID=A0A9P6JSC7_9AGAR|nr:hypothetical protein CPB83DRAFT_850328 [Crepidotus variabilis]